MPAARRRTQAIAITFVIPWNPGGGTDTGSRALAAVLQRELAQPVAVVNRTGGGGVVGHLALASARADGYTIGAITVEITMMHCVGRSDLTSKDYEPRAHDQPGRRRAVTGAG